MANIEHLMKGRVTYQEGLPVLWLPAGLSDELWTIKDSSSVKNHVRALLGDQLDNPLTEGAVYHPTSRKGIKLLVRVIPELMKLFERTFLTLHEIGDAEWIAESEAALKILEARAWDIKALSLSYHGPDEDSWERSR